MKKSPLKGKGGRKESRHWKLSEKGWAEHQKFDHHQSPLGYVMKNSPFKQNEYDPNYAGDAEKLLEEVNREAANYAPEYDPPPTQEQREADPNYQFFITNRSDESDQVAKTLDSLKYHSIHGGPKGRSANLKQQRAILKQYNLK